MQPQQQPQQAGLPAGGQAGEERGCSRTWGVPSLPCMLWHICCVHRLQPSPRLLPPLLCPASSTQVLDALKAKGISIR